MSGRREAPLYVDGLRSARWVVENVPPSTPVGGRIHQHALALCETLAVALASHTPDEALQDADETLIRLRVLLRLALDVALISEGGFLHLSGEFDGIGRQVGGWLRKLADRGVHG